MVPYIKIFLDVDQYRGPTLGILEQLAEINPEEFMSTAIGALCSSTRQELGLKRDLLQVAAYYTSYMTSLSLSVAHAHQKILRYAVILAELSMYSAIYIKS